MMQNLDKLWVAVRALLYALAGAGVAYGYFTQDDVDKFWAAVTPIASAVLGLATLIYVYKTRPSPTGIEAGKATDKMLETGQTQVVETPAGQPNVVVAAERTS